MPNPTIRVNHQNRELSFPDAICTVGGRLGVDVVLDDVMVADRHCVIDWDGGFRVRDSGSVTGTWVDGERAAPAAALHDGAKIVIGTTEIAVAIGDDDGAPRLDLTVAPQSFRWWQPAKKGAFDNDPDALVRSEVGFGRFPALRASNRAAIVAGLVLLVAATFVGAVMQPLADPGPLQPTHALVTAGTGRAAPAGPAAADAADPPPAQPGRFAQCAALVDAQGCDVCHTTGDGAPEAKCAQCHGLPGEIGARGSWRHPYLVDGQVGALDGMATAPQQFCVLCHTDHRGATTYKPARARFVAEPDDEDPGPPRCGACHAAAAGDVDPVALRDRLVEKAPIDVAAPRPTPYDSFSFPHAPHLAKSIGCQICHRVDPEVQAARARGVPDDPGRQDFAPVPYETCRQCHVPGAEAAGLTAEERDRWRASDHQWPVTWHGSDDEGRHCKQCHAAVERGGATVVGPERKVVVRGAFTSEQYAAERARYTSPARLHEPQFDAHRGDRACSECHLDGKVEAIEPRPARTFWHGLHLAKGALAPAGDATVAARISTDTAQGCTSCHDDLAGNKALQPATDGPWHWPTDAAAQRPCQSCHKDAEGRPLALAPARVAIAPERTREATDFPHDVHLKSAAYGKQGDLAAGCFACHAFTAPVGERQFTQVPVTSPGARDCSQCHQGHANIAGGSCQKCHPAVAGTRNSFLDSARVAEPAPPTRPWPAPNGFSHLSPGHSSPKLTCASCHADFGLDKATTLGDVRVPDESAKLCRDCHLQRQFHWR